MIATAGNYGDKHRSDCYISLELNKSGGIKIELQSKVKSLYGESIVTLFHEILAFFTIEHAALKIEDKGALPFVLAARLEAVIKQVLKTDKEYLPEMLSVNINSSKRDRYRNSRLYLPGNTPSLMINAAIHKPDAVILDLEDAVAFNKKHEARLLVRNALRSLDFLGVERMVRINQIPEGLEDLDYIIPHNVNLVLVPKCESDAQLHLVNERIAIIQKKVKSSNPIWLMPIIESAMGLMNALEIAQAADNVVAMAIGLEDYTADLGVNRTKEGTESLFARCQVINACKAVGIQPIDSVFSDIGDVDGLRENALNSKALGFEGMGCIHPRQIKIIHDAFSPNETEIENAMKVVKAYAEAIEKGLGVISLGTKMIDAPVVKRAQRTIDLAISLGKLDVNWKNSMNTQA